MDLLIILKLFFGLGAIYYFIRIFSCFKHFWTNLKARESREFSKNKNKKKKKPTPSETNTEKEEVYE